MGCLISRVMKFASVIRKWWTLIGRTILLSYASDVKLSLYIRQSTDVYRQCVCLCVFFYFSVYPCGTCHQSTGCRRSDSQSPRSRRAQYWRNTIRCRKQTGRSADTGRTDRQTDGQADREMEHERVSWMSILQRTTITFSFSSSTDPHSLPLPGKLTLLSVLQPRLDYTTAPSPRWLYIKTVHNVT